MEESIRSKYIKICGVVALYWFVSISMVFVNKTILGNATNQTADAPLFVTFFQCFITVLCCLIISLMKKVSPKLTKTEITFDINTAKKILPLSIVFVGMITGNNLCLKYVGVAFYYVGRSLTTVFNVLFTYLILGQSVSKNILLCCATIISGFWLGVDQESSTDSFSLTGIIFGVFAASCVALNSIYTKKVLPYVDGSIWLLSFYNNVLACILFVPLMIVFGELPKIYLLFTDKDIFFWILMVISGLFGFAIGYVTGLQIQVTSPLTHMVSGTAKACTQTVMATWWYVEMKSNLWWISNWVVLGGSMAYSYFRTVEMKQQKPVLPTFNKNDLKDSKDMEKQEPGVPRIENA